MRVALNTRLLAAAFVVAALPVQAAWQGEIRQEDGATVVVNPETPALGEETYELRELWRRGGEDDDILFGTVSEFLHDDEGNIYLLDGQLSEIQVFAPDGEHLRTIGRDGEGPGEFRNGADMFWSPGGQIGVVQAWPGKIVMLTPDGLPGQEYPLPFRKGGGFQSVTRGDGDNERLVLAGVAWTREGEQQMQLTYLKAYGADGSELASFCEASSPVNFGNYEFVEEDYVDFQRRWAMAPDGRVAVARSFTDYRIHVYGPDGALERIITRPDYQAVKRTGDEVERFRAMYSAFTRWNRGSTFKASEQHDTVSQIFYREDGTLWVQSSQGRWRAAEGTFTAFDVYDREGRFLRRVNLVADVDAATDGLFFTGDRAYVVTDLYDAIMARFGAGGDGGEAAVEAEPVEVVSFVFAPDHVALGKGGGKAN
jgi:hypothetical protein